MSHYRCPECHGEFPGDHSKCPWCGQAMDGSVDGATAIEIGGGKDEADDPFGNLFGLGGRDG